MAIGTTELVLGAEGLIGAELVKPLLACNRKLEGDYLRSRYRGLVPAKNIYQKISLGDNGSRA
jgi:hypothetical protein